MRPRSRAIASQAAGEIYGLRSLAADVEDRPDNTTRFRVLGRTLLAPSGCDKTTLLMSMADTEAPGALYRLLEPLARHGISMTRIESRPSLQRKWHYVFFVDILGHASDPGVAPAIEELAGIAGLFRVLGAYPRGV